MVMPHPAGHGHILIAEDHGPLARLLRDICLINGFRSSVAANGAEGKSIFGGARFDLVITDMNMPVCDGNELVRHIRSLDRAVPIVVITGNVAAVAEDVAEMATRVMEKPLDLPRAMTGLLEELLGRGVVQPD